MKEQTITATIENTAYVPPLSASGAKAFYSVFLEKIMELSKSEKATAA